MKPYVVRYDKSRFPIQPKRDDGSWGCRGCCGEIKPPRRAWCGPICVKRFNPQNVLFAVKRRDKGFCHFCGQDCKLDFTWWDLSEYAKRSMETRPETIGWFKPELLRRRHHTEIDHIIPMAEGGLTVVENLRTLCEDCHKARTKAWHAQRKRAKIVVDSSLVLHLT